VRADCLQEIRARVHEQMEANMPRSAHARPGAEWTRGWDDGWKAKVPE